MKKGYPWDTIASSGKDIIEKQIKPRDETKIPINETYTKSCKKTTLWEVQNTCTEEVFKEPKLEATFRVTLREMIAPRSAELQKK